MQSEEIGHLGGENRQRDTGREANHDRIWYELDDRAEMEQPHQQQDTSGHKRGHCQTRQTVNLNDVIDNYDECTRRTTDLHGVAAEGTYNETAYDSRHQTDCRTNAACYGESDCQRQSHNSYYNSRNQILAELLHAVISACRYQRGMKIQTSYCFHKTSIGSRSITFSQPASPNY